MGQFLRTTIKTLGQALKKHRRCLSVLLVLNGALWGIPALYMAIFTPPDPEVTLPSVNDLKQAQYNIYVANWGFHTAIILEQPSGWSLGPPNHPQARYVEYSWGDKGFFMLADSSIPGTLAAGVLPTASVVYLRGRDALPTEQNGVRQLYHRQVTPQQLHSLVDALEQSFQREPQGDRVEPYTLATRFAGQFFPGREYYVIWSDCNAWTLKHLDNIDVAHSSVPVIFSEQVGPSLKGFRLIQGSE